MRGTSSSRRRRACATSWPCSRSRPSGRWSTTTWCPSTPARRRGEALARRYSVLMVCTGNICRSPTAEGVLRHRVREAGLADRVHIDSAGTHDYHVGSPPDERSSHHASLRGYDLSDQRARQVQPADFERFDLILAMDNGHMELLEDDCPP